MIEIKGKSFCFKKKETGCYILNRYCYSLHCYYTIGVSTYELANGKTVSDIAKMAGGGDLRVNTHQIEHLGLKGRSIVYQVPTCYKALRHNICYATDECAGIESGRVW